jgi:hypothetical protein
VVLKDLELHCKIMDESHSSRYSIHLGTNKMYQDLKKNFWWTRMKRQIVKYVSECDTCRRVKADHLRPARNLQPLSIPKWKWENICTDFNVGLPLTLRRYKSIWVIMVHLTNQPTLYPYPSLTGSDGMSSSTYHTLFAITASRRPSSPIEGLSLLLAFGNNCMNV